MEHLHPLVRLLASAIPPRSPRSGHSYPVYRERHGEGQIKLACKYAVDHGHPERYVVISMLKSFLGRTLATATATGQEIVHNPKWFSPLPEGFRYAEYTPGYGSAAKYVASTVREITLDASVDVYKRQLCSLAF